MNKTSGKLAAGVRKVKTLHKTPAVIDKAPPPPVAPQRVAAAPAPRVAAAALHPDRVWPD